MKLIKLEDIKEFPAYVEHFGKFYMVRFPINQETSLPCVTAEGSTSLKVTPNRKANVFTEEEYKAHLEAKLQALETVEERAKNTSVADNSVTSGAVVEATSNAKAALAAQLAARSKGKTEGAPTPEVPSSTTDNGPASN